MSIKLHILNYPLIIETHSNNLFDICAIVGQYENIADSHEEFENINWNSETHPIKLLLFAIHKYDTMTPTKAKLILPSINRSLKHWNNALFKDENQLNIGPNSSFLCNLLTDIKILLKECVNKKTKLIIDMI